jgi:replicative superfamily II helicase
MDKRKKKRKKRQRPVIEFLDTPKTTGSKSPWEKYVKTSKVEVKTAEAMKNEEDETQFNYTMPCPTDSFEELVQKFEEMKGYSLEPEQVEALRNVYYNKKNFLFVAPTGFGKSCVPEFMAFIGWKFIYTGPLKSLANEKLGDFSSITQTMRDTGDDFKRRRTHGFVKELEKSNVIVATYERLDSILRKPSRDRHIQDKVAVVIDEIHVIGNKSRGHVIEGLILKLTKLLPNIRVIGLSATLPNYSVVSEWLDADLVAVPESRRPIPLKYEYQNPIFNGPSSQETDQKRFQLMKHMKERDHLTNITFCSSRMRVEGLARTHIGADRKTGPLSLLKKDLKTAVSFHHAGLTMKQKEVIEGKFRSAEIKKMYTTTTFAMGVNLPADVCYFFDLSRWNPKKSQKVLYEEDEVLQIAGRAGRRSSPSGTGLCVFFGTDEELSFAQEAVNNPKGAQSQLNRYLVGKILEWIVTDIAIDKQTVLEVALSSLASFQGLYDEDRINEAIIFLFQHGFIEFQSDIPWALASKEEVDDEFWKPTKLGEMTCKLYMNPITVIAAEKNIHELLVDGAEVIEDGDLMNHLNIYNAILSVEEMTDSVTVREMDNELIKKARSYLGDFNNIMSDEMAKLTGLIFSRDIKKHNPYLKIFIPAGDKRSMKIQSIRMIDCLASILVHSEKLKESMIFIKPIMDDVSLLIKYEEFNVSKLDQFRLSSSRKTRRYGNR